VAAATPATASNSGARKKLQKQVADGRESIRLPDQRKLDGIRMRGRLLRMVLSCDFAQQAVDQVV
jgi:hypothetical protein